MIFTSYNMTNFSFVQTTVVFIIPLMVCICVPQSEREKKLHFKRGSLFFPLLSEVIFSTITFELSSLVHFPEGQSPNLQGVTRSA